MIHSYDCVTCVTSLGPADVSHVQPPLSHTASRIHVYSIHDNTACHSNSMRLSIHLEQAHLVGPFFYVENISTHVKLKLTYNITGTVYVDKSPIVTTLGCSPINAV